MGMLPKYFPLLCVPGILSAVADGKFSLKGAGDILDNFLGVSSMAIEVGLSLEHYGELSISMAIETIPHAWATLIGDTQFVVQVEVSIHIPSAAAGKKSLFISATHIVYLTARVIPSI